MKNKYDVRITLELHDIEAETPGEAEGTAIGWLKEGSDDFVILNTWVEGPIKPSYEKGGM